ncbi:hypothetical protein WA577_002680 [Blastocystis sp. JDR]
MTKYQKDLDVAVLGIRNLQVESDTIAMRVKNRKCVASVIHDVVSHLTLQPSTVNCLISGEMNDAFFSELQKFSGVLDYVDCVDVDDATMLKRSGIKAIESIRVDMNILKLHCGNRVRDAVFRKIAEISKDSNIEMFQKEVILKLKTGVLFLQRHLPQYYQEVEAKYAAVMKKVVLDIFSEYYGALSKRLFEVGGAEDLIVTPKPKSLLKKRGKMVSPYQTAVFTLGDRHSVVDFMGAEPLLPSILASEGRFVSFPELFRSVQQHLIACALAEFEFEVQFFNVEDSALFIDVFGGACELLHLGAVEWIRGSYDIVGMLLFCVLLQGAVERLAKEGVPILQEFFLNLRAKSMFRFKELLALQVRSVKAVPVQPKNLEVDGEVHPSIRNYAELSCAVYVIGHSYESLVSRELWAEGMEALALEMVNLLMKLASCVRENKRPSFILSCCLYVAEVYESRHVTVENEFMKLYEDRLRLYVEEMLAKLFAPLVGLVDKYGDRKSGVAFSTTESKNIQKYNAGWREALRAANERIRGDFKYHTIAVFNLFASEVTSYHSRFVQLLQGTPFAKDVVPLQTFVGEVMRYRSEYESGVMGSVASSA